MEDIITNNYYRVLGQLESFPGHIRDISRKIGLSHTQVGKILNYFYNLGVLKRKSVGKSIIYEIEENNLSLNYLVISNKLKLIDLINKEGKIKIIFEKVFLKLKNILKDIDCLILFGSYSKGFQKKSSDIDLFFISKLDIKLIKNKIKEIEESFGIKINIKVLTKEEIETERKHPFTIEILEGIPLINSEFFYRLKWQK